MLPYKSKWIGDNDVSCYHLFALTCANTFDCLQTNTADDYIHNYKSALRLYPASLSFEKKCLLQDSSWHTTETEKIFLELNTLHVVKELSQMIC